MGQHSHSTGDWINGYSVTPGVYTLDDDGVPRRVGSVPWWRRFGYALGRFGQGQWAPLVLAALLAVAAIMQWQAAVAHRQTLILLSQAAETMHGAATALGGCDAPDDEPPAPESRP